MIVLFACLSGGPFFFQYQVSFTPTGVNVSHEQTRIRDSTNASCLSPYFITFKSQWFSFRNTGNSRATQSTVSVTDDDEHERENVLSMGNVRLDSRKNFFTVRVINGWNRIPDAIKEQKSVNAFKNRYDEWRRIEIRRQQQQL